MARFSLGERKFYYYYFLLHIPITLLIDSSVVVPPEYHPASKLVEWHIAQNNDFLLWEKPNWLYWFVVIELVVQLPLFAKFALALRPSQATNSQEKDEKVEKESKLNRWLRIYGLNASFTTLICMITIWQRGYRPFFPTQPLQIDEKIQLLLVYLPTFLIPLRLCFL